GAGAPGRRRDLRSTLQPGRIGSVRSADPGEQRHDGAPEGPGERAGTRAAARPDHRADRPHDRIAPPGARAGGRDMARRATELLARVPLFAGLSKRHLRAIASIAEEKRFDEGTVIAKEGEPGEDFFVIVEGQASVPRGSRNVARPMPGDFFGEIALLDEGPRMATVVAETPLTVMTLNRKPFQAVLEREPTI